MNYFKANNLNVPIANAIGFLSAGLWAIVMFLEILSPTGLNLWVWLGMPLLMWQWMNIMGQSVGLHRFFTHATFKTNRFWQWVLAYSAMVSLSGPPCIWMSTHAKHHQVADTEEDPYVKLMLTGETPFTHTTIVNPHFIKRMCVKDRLHYLTLKYHWLYVISFPLSLLVIGSIYYAFTSSALLLALPLVAWIIPAGMSQLTLRFLLWTSHIEGIGYRTFDTKDNSNNWWFCSIIAAGEGWHNNHHKYPKSAKLGIKWWEFDIGYWIIRMIGHDVVLASRQSKK